MKHVDLMIFDFDGTLVNSLEDIAASVNYTLNFLNLPAKSPDLIMNYIGDGVHKLIERSMEGQFVASHPEAIEKFRLHYNDHLLDTTKPCEYVFEILDFFKNKNKVIITNKPIGFTIKIAEALNLANHFDEIIGGNSNPFKKPDSRLLPPLFDRFHATADKTVVIGDGVNDILLAKNGGTLSCALLNGFSKRKDLEELEPDFICENIFELTTLFC